MTLTVRLDRKVEEELAVNAVRDGMSKSGMSKSGMSKSEAVKRALERLFEQESVPAAANPAAARFVGSDKGGGDVARHTKRLLREHFRGK